MKTYQKQTNYKPIIITIAAIVLVLIGVGIIFAWNTANQPEQANDNAVPGVNYNPPTEEEAEGSQDGKKNNTPGKSESDNSSKNKQSVLVGVAFAGYDTEEEAVDIRAFTPDVIEGDGICTATLTNGSLEVTKSEKAFIDSSSSQCRPILISRSDFSVAGTWKLVVTYNSSKNSGSSPPMDVEIQ